MAFRIEKAACLIFANLAIAAGQDLSFTAQRQHLHKGSAGSLVFTDTGVRWEETARHEYSREWEYADIQRLELAPDHVRIVTYDGIGWQFGRDREYVFDHLAEDLAKRIYPILAARLDQRFVAHFADPAVTEADELPAKLLVGRGGSNGVLKIGADRIVFDGGERGESRTWRYRDITCVSSAGPFDLTFTTVEGETRLQLKQALPEERYNTLWRQITATNGLRMYGSEAAHQH